MATGASIAAAKLTANWIGQEVEISDDTGVVTLTGVIDKFSIRRTAPARDEKGNAAVPRGLDGLTVKVWIEGHKLVIRGGNKLSLLEGGLPGDLPNT